MNSKTNNDSAAYGMDKINIQFLDKSKKELPLVISPRFDNSLPFIYEWLNVNRQWVQDQMLQYGAVLIRGFDINSPTDFEKATLALDPSLCDKYRGTSPRSLQDGTKYTFSAADVPVNYPIAQHLEMSFLKAPPKNLYFGCMKGSQSEGGETSLCDFRKVYQDLSPELRNKFLTKKIKYSRKHYKVGEKYTYDVGAMKTWCQLFGTEDKQEVERISQEEDAPKVQWLGPNQDTFYQEWIDDPIQSQASTGKKVWFNHSQVFHWSTFPAELWFAFCRLKSVQLFIHFVLVSIYTFVKYGILGYKMSLDTTFGDDTPITYNEMSEVRSAIHKNLVFSRWEKGDILCIDNFTTSHGRQPTHDRSRKVIVAWSQPQTKPSMANNTTTAYTIVAHDQELNSSTSMKIMNIKNIPDLVAITPGSTPETSLTKEAATELQNSFLNSTRSKANKNYEVHINDKLLDLYSEQQQQQEHAGKQYKNEVHKRGFSCPNLFADNSDFWKKCN